MFTRNEPEEFTTEIHNHLCVQCGVMYQDENEDDGICLCCRDEREE